MALALTPIGMCEPLAGSGRTVLKLCRQVETGAPDGAGTAADDDGALPGNIAGAARAILPIAFQSRNPANARTPISFAGRRTNPSPVCRARDTLRRLASASGPRRSAFDICAWQAPITLHAQLPHVNPKYRDVMLGPAIPSHLLTGKRLISCVRRFAAMSKGPWCGVFESHRTIAL